MQLGGAGLQRARGPRLETPAHKAKQQADNTEDECESRAQRASE